MLQFSHEDDGSRLSGQGMGSSLRVHAGAQAWHFSSRKVVQTLTFVIFDAGFNGRRPQVRWLALWQRLQGLEHLCCSRVTSSRCHAFPVP